MHGLHISHKRIVNPQTIFHWIAEIITDKHPFFKISIEAMVTMAIMIGGSPLTEDYPELPATDPLWDIMRECWKEEPTERATIVTVLGKVCNFPFNSFNRDLLLTSTSLHIRGSSANTLKLEKTSLRPLRNIEERKYTKFK